MGMATYRSFLADLVVYHEECIQQRSLERFQAAIAIKGDQFKHPERENVELCL